MHLSSHIINSQERIDAIDMYILTIYFQIDTSDCFSLKEKRSIVKGLIAKLRDKTNFAIAEVDELNNWKLASLGACSISNEAIYLEKLSHKFETYIEKIYPGRLQEYDHIITQHDELMKA